MSVAFALPTYRVWKRTGINPVTFGRTDSAHDYVGMMFRLVMLTLSLVISISAVSPSVNEYLIPIFWLDAVVSRYAGYVMLAVSLAWIVTAQLQMADSWRIGIDQEKTQTRHHRCFRDFAKPDLSRDAVYPLWDFAGDAYRIYSVSLRPRLRSDSDPSAT